MAKYQWKTFDGPIQDPAELESDELVFAKKEEMILPAALSERLEQWIFEAGTYFRFVPLGSELDRESDDKSLATCATTYANKITFHGYPHIPSTPTLLVRGVEMEACKCGIVRADCDIHKR